MAISRRNARTGAASGAVVAAVGQVVAQPDIGLAIEPNDRVFTTRTLRQSSIRDPLWWRPPPTSRSPTRARVRHFGS